MKNVFVAAFSSAVLFFSVLGFAQDDKKVQIPVADPPAKGPSQAAGGEAAKKADSKPADFSKGFALFEKLGIPDISKGKYVKLEAYSSGMDNYYMSKLPLKGNAWLIKEEPEGLNVFVSYNGKILKKYSRDYAQKKFKNKTPDESNMEQFASDQQELFNKSATWKDADLASDVKALLEFMRKSAPETENTNKKHSSRNEDFASLIQNGSELPANLFLYAVQAYRYGKKDEANEIVATLFDSGVKRSDVVNSALSELAGNQYEISYSDFCEDKNWKNYVDGMEVLIKRYNQNSWQGWSAVSRICAEVKKRLGNPNPPELAGEGITDEDKALAKEMCSGDCFGGKGGRFSRVFYGGDENGNMLWTLPANKPAEKKEEAEKKSEKISTIDKIRNRGLASLPMLTALLSDEYMTDTVQDPNEMSRTYYGSSRQMKMSKEILEGIYKSTPKPMKRSDVAKQLLQEVVFDPDLVDNEDNRYGREEKDIEEFKKICASFTEKIKGKTPLEITKMYMEHGNDDQKSKATDFLIENGGAEESAMIEKYFLDSVSGENNYRSALHSNSIDKYVGKKGKDAKVFVEKFAQKMKEKYGDVVLQDKKKEEKPKDKVEPGKEKPKDGTKAEEEDSMYVKASEANANYEVKAAREKIRALKELVDSGSLEEMLAQLVSGEKKYTNSTARVLASKMQEIKKDEVVGLILGTFFKTQDAKLREKIMTLMYTAQYMGYMPRRMKKTEQDKPNPKLHADLWKKLFAEKTPSRTDYPNSPTWGQTGLSYFESIYGASPERAAQRTSYGLGSALGDKRYYNLLQEKADAMLEGKTGDAIPAFPDAKNVSEQRKTEIGTALKKENADTMQAFLDKLSNDELLATIALVKDSKELNEKMIPFANRICTVNSSSPDIQKKLDELKGQLIGKATVEKIANLAREIFKTEDSFDFSISRKAGFNGVELGYFSKKPGTKVKKNPAPKNKKDKTLIFGIYGPGFNARFAESDKAGKTKEPGNAEAGKSDADDLINSMEGELEEDISAGMEEQKQEFWKSVEKLSSPECPSGDGTSIDMRTQSSPYYGHNTEEIIDIEDGNYDGGDIIVD